MYEKKETTKGTNSCCICALKKYCDIIMKGCSDRQQACFLVAKKIGFEEIKIEACFQIHSSFKKRF